MKLNIDSSAIVKFTNELEKMHRSALPVVVRQTLNGAAFDVKKNTMPQYAKENFEKRNPNFFKANSKVDQAKGFNISSMISKVGFVSTNLKGGQNNSVKNLEHQEQGGTIKSKSFIPLDTARSGNKNSRPVTSKNRISSFDKIVKTKDAPIKTRDKKIKKQQYYKTINFVGVGGLFMSEHKGNTLLARVNTLGKWGVKPKISILYTYKKSRTVQVKRTNFMYNASRDSGKKMESYFVAHFERYLKKIKK